MPLQSGTILKNRYRIERVLAQGGMGAVYEAFDVNLGVRVAVKENLFTTEEYARQFRREATILASLRHPNLPRVTDHFVIEGEGQYLVMDFIEGIDLRERLEGDGKVFEEEAIPWFLAIADALAYLHSRKPPILHRDIKPGNIKIIPDGRVMLVDFGLAKIESGSTTSTGAKAMTPGFSPPEQYGAGRTDPRTDIYSLGATMYASLTASVPEESLQRAMGREKLTPVRKLNAAISAGVAKVIEKALAIHPEDRYQSVREMANALRSISGAGQPTLVRSYPYLERTKITPVDALRADLVRRRVEPSRWRRRLPSIILITLSLSLVAVGVLYAVPIYWPRVLALLTPIANTPQAPTPIGTERPGPEPSPTGFAVLSTDPSPGSTLQATSSSPLPGTQSVTNPPLSTPRGGSAGQITYVSEKSGLPQIYLLNLDRIGERQLTSMDQGACQPAWSPDGLKLIFTSPCLSRGEEYIGSGLFLITFDLIDAFSDPVPLKSITGGGGNYDSAWALDGQRIAFTSRRDGIPQVYIVNMDGTGLLNLNDDLAFNRQPAWSPDGEQLIFTTSRGGIKEIWIMPDTGRDPEIQFSRGDGREESHADWSRDGELIVFQRKIGPIPVLVASRPESEGRIDFRICPEGEIAGYPMAEPSWSPDGNWILFETWPDGKNHNVAYITANCTDFTELTSDPALDFDPVWRPIP